MNDGVEKIITIRGLLFQSRMLFLELLQGALGNRVRLSRVPTAEEWEEIYEESGRQAVTGILLHGIDRLPAE